MISFHGDEVSLCNGLIILNIRVENASCFGREHFLFIYSVDLQYVLILRLIIGINNSNMLIADLRLEYCHKVTDYKSATSGFPLPIFYNFLS
ncbi:hypothetical protein D3C71_00050 [compost metagenome]